MKHIFEQEKRKQIYGGLQKVLVEDMPTAFVAFGNTIFATCDKITGIKPRPAPHEHGGLTGELWWNVEESEEESGLATGRSPTTGELGKGVLIAFCRYSLG